MTTDLLDSLRLYVREKAKADGFAAHNAKLNGYTDIALRHENEAALGFKILRELDKENAE